MTNNKGDRIIKEQVDNLQVSFDKEAAWMRLQDRMESRDEKMTYSRIGLAAAAMLMLATILWYSFSENKQEIVKQETTQPAQAITPEITTSRIERPIEERATTQVAKMQTQKTIRTTQQVIPQNIDPLPPPEEVVPPVTAQEEKTIVPEVAVKILISKPRMKVVHINEVLEDNEREYMMRDRYAVEEYLQKTKIHNNDEPDYKSSERRDPFNTNHIIQN